ncbi:hypothetical protein HG530_008212 [Fusarium avenaceum]|nr:hypothetical protein HG530_008212 [Fusarium avenaceum]
MYPLRDSRILTSKGSSRLGNLLSLGSLHLGTSRVLLSLKLQPLNMLSSLTHTQTSLLKGTIGLTLGHLGALDTLAGLDNSRVEVLAATAETRHEAASGAVAAVGRAGGGG